MLHYAKYSAEIVGLFCNIVGLFCHIVGLFATEFSGMLQSLHLDLRNHNEHLRNGYYESSLFRTSLCTLALQNSDLS